ncbi:alpha-(1,3)-fucosyltransferase C-like [Mya arenaria]|uniref:alpha-(1,3)-fucosyltransferase C-like n=1 Tax=Mya arenaria TaxID=6604 RepID=UPI0022E2E810|nr:alpha-(1,3)-fucosyltransferase C-like [Mya arenaria]
MIPRLYIRYIKRGGCVMICVSVLLGWLVTHKNNDLHVDDPVTTVPVVHITTRLVVNNSVTVNDSAIVNNSAVVNSNGIVNRNGIVNNSGIVNSSGNTTAIVRKCWNRQCLNDLMDVKIRYKTGVSWRKSNLTKKRILWYKDPGTNITDTTQMFTNCEYSNCVATDKVSEVNHVDAVIFTVSSLHMGQQPPFKRENPDQAWIFKLGESPYGRGFSEYSSSHWRNQVNWSSSLNLDTDMPHGAGFIKTRTTIIEKDYDAIFTGKNKTALWIVSNCRTQSKRELYVRKLQNSGLDVDIYGSCGKGKIQPDDVQRLIGKYKYYLAFENSFCSDYITEKFLMNYNHDWILVARGGADYRKVIPTQTYVNSAEFESPAKLAEYLNNLASDKDRYVKLLKEKDKYEAQYGAGWPYFLCELCHRLNHLSEYRHSYPDIAEHLQKDRCFKPRDNSGLMVEGCRIIHILMTLFILWH